MGFLPTQLVSLVQQVCTLWCPSRWSFISVIFQAHLEDSCQRLPEKSSCAKKSYYIYTYIHTMYVCIYIYISEKSCHLTHQCGACSRSQVICFYFCFYFPFHFQFLLYHIPKQELGQYHLPPPLTTAQSYKCQPEINPQYPKIQPEFHPLTQLHNEFHLLPNSCFDDWPKPWHKLVGHQKSHASCHAPARDHLVV